MLHAFYVLRLGARYTSPATVWQGREETAGGRSKLSHCQQESRSKLSYCLAGASERRQHEAELCHPPSDTKDRRSCSSRALPVSASQPLRGNKGQRPDVRASPPRPPSSSASLPCLASSPAPARSRGVFPPKNPGSISTPHRPDLCVYASGRAVAARTRSHPSAQAACDS